MSYSFIKIKTNIQACLYPLPIDTIEDLRFFIEETYNSNNFSGVDILDLDGNFIRSCSYDYSNGFLSLKSTAINDLTCFVLAIKYDTDTLYSNAFNVVPDVKYTTLLKYLCDTDEFGFTYSITNSYNQVRLPIIIEKPQYKQDDNVYVDLVGNRRVISSKIDTEYTLDTEYMPSDLHEAMVIALSHDYVYLNGERMQRTESYEVNYEEYDQLTCGTKLYKASAKLAKNTTIRNTNC